MTETSNLKHIKEKRKALVTDYLIFYTFDLLTHYFQTFIFV